MIEDLPKFKFILSDGLKSWDLPHAPDGWEESFLEWSRSFENFGIMRSYSVPLKWVKDGAFFLREKFYGDNGIESFTLVEIKKLYPPTLEYLPYYTGAIDYSTFVDQDTFVFASLMDSGLDAKIKAYQSTLYDIPLSDDPDAVNVILSGIELQETAHFIIDIPPNIDNAITNNRAIVGVTLQAFEQKSNVVTAKSTIYEREQAGTDADPATTEEWFYKASIDTDVHIKGSIEFRSFNDSRNSVPLQVLFQFVVADGQITYSPAYPLTGQTVPTVPANDTWKHFFFEYEFTIPLKEGQHILLYYQHAPSAQWDAGTEVIPTGFDVSAKTRSPESTIKAMHARTLFDRIIAKINGGITQRTRSGLLDNEFRDMLYTSGDALRGLAGASIKISLDSFLKDWFAIAAAGFGIEREVAVLERRDYFFRKAQRIGTLKHVRTAIFEVSEAFIYSTITTGSPDNPQEEVNAKSEVNSEQHWTMPITRVSQDYNIKTESRTDAYGIEFTRINLQGKTTTDSASDNDSFILDTFFDHYLGYKMATKNERFVEVEGVAAPDSVYNLVLSPKKNLLRHNFWLASAAWGMEDYYINFQSALRNAELRTVDFSHRVHVEKENIHIPTLGPKIYVPILATIRAIYDKNLHELINNTPYGYLEFVWEDNTYRGYIMNASVGPTRNEDKEFKLLLTSDNNLLNLIR